MFILSALGTRIGKAVAAVLAGAAFLYAVFTAGKRAERETARVDELEEFIETQKEIDDVEVSPDSDAAFERLRDNGWLR